MTEVEWLAECDPVLMLNFLAHRRAIGSCAYPSAPACAESGTSSKTTTAAKQWKKQSGSLTALGGPKIGKNFAIVPLGPRLKYTTGAMSSPMAWDTLGYSPLKRRGTQ